MKTACIIEARMSSSRLPGKVLMPLAGKPALERMIERLNHAETLDQIIVACTEKSHDDELQALAERLQVGVFRGSEDDVLLRVLKAAEHYKVDLIVETPGDFPLIDPHMVDKAVSDFMVGGTDFVVNEMPYATLPGSDIRVFKTKDLAYINEISCDPADHEHVSIYFAEHPEKFRVRSISTDLKLKDSRSLRLSLDTLEDYQVISKIFSDLYLEQPKFSMADVFEYLERHPEIRRINENVITKKIR